MIRMLNKKLFLLIAMFCFGICSFSYAQSFGGGSCQRSGCSNSTCQLIPDSQGHLQKDCPNGKTARYDVDPNCVMNNNAKQGSCLDTMPVSSITRVSETNCYRNKGWDRKRNHLGTDYAATTGTYVTAAADGNVFWAKELDGGGRTIMIEHQKQCQCSADDKNDGCDDKYVTVYMHLSAYAVQGGYVKKGDVIGLVGGSNYSSSTKILCDPGQEYASCKPYGPHLHFEIHSGSANKGYKTLKTSIIDPLCDNIQSFCGGCSYNVQEECLNKTNTNQWTTLNDDAKKDKKVSTPPANLSTGYGTLSASEGMSSQNSGGKCDLSNFLPEKDKCYFCPLFRTLFNTASIMAAKSYDALAGGVANVVIVAFALWIALYVLKHVSAIEVQKPSKMIQGLLVQAFRVLIVIVILKISYGEVLKLTLDPVFNTGMKYVQTISGSDGCPSNAAYMKDIKGYDEMSSSGGLPKSMGQNIVCSIKTMQDSIYKLVSYGRQARCVAWHDQATVFGLFPSLSYLITGWGLMLGGFILLLAFPWCLVDCVLNMAIASALLPAAVGAWAFKITAGYLKKIWDFFMNAMFNFVFLSIIIYLIMMTANEFMHVIDVGVEKDWTLYVDPINGLAWWGVTFMKLFVVCLLGWAFLDQAKQLADKFAKAPSVGVGKTTGGFFAQAGTRMALGRKDEDGKRHGGALGVGKDLWHLGGDARRHFVNQPAKRFINRTQIAHVKQNGKAITDANGNVIGYQMAGKNGVNHRVDIDQNGKELLSKEIRNKDGSVTRISKDHLLTVTETRDASGNIISKGAEFNADSVKYLVGKDGRINTEMVAQLQQGSRFGKETMDVAIAQEVLKQRGINVTNLKDMTKLEDGTFVFRQTDKNGTLRTMTARMDGGDQMVTTYHSIDAKGNERYVKDNGIQRMDITKQAGKAAVTSFSWNSYYREHSSYHQFMDKNGEFKGIIKEEDGMRGFSEAEKRLHMAQIRTGESQAYAVRIENGHEFIDIQPHNGNQSV